MTAGPIIDRRGMARRPPEAIAADKRAEACSAQRGAGFDGQRQVEETQIDNPYDDRPAAERGKVTANCNTQATWSGSMKKLSEAQRKAGDIFLVNYHMAGYCRGLSRDITIERVDMSGYSDLFPVNRIDANSWLSRTVRVLGVTGYALIVAVCCERVKIKGLARQFASGDAQEYAEKYIGKRFREALDDLAVHLGLSLK